MAKAKSAVDETEDTATPVLPVVKPVGELVEVAVTKFGDGRVSTGMHVAGEGDIYAARGDKILVSKEVASSLEARGFAETE